MPYLPEIIEKISPTSDCPYMLISDDDDPVAPAQEPPTKRTRLAEPSPGENSFSDAVPSHTALSANDLESERNRIVYDDGRRTSIIADTKNDRDTPSGQSNQSTLELRHVHVPGPAYPLSAFEGQALLDEVSEETLTIKDLTSHYTSGHIDDHRDFKCFTLNNFAIYRKPGGKHAGELVCLDKLLNNGYPCFLVDGELSVGRRRHLVKGLPFEILTVDGYLDTNNVSALGNLCIQSPLAKRANVWYNLGQPSAIYKRFFDPFTWLVQFTKHVVNYLFEHEAVALGHLKTHFYKWLAARYLEPGANYNPLVVSWLSHVAFRDFRTTFNANVAFIHKECFSIDDNTGKLLQHPVWEEVDWQRLKAIPAQPSSELRTIVTSFAWDCFRNMYFGDQLEERIIKAPALQVSVATRKKKMLLTPLMVPQASGNRWSATVATYSPPTAPLKSQLQPQAGDVVAVKPFGDGWGRSTSAIWYAYVQRVRTVDPGTRLDVLWLYHPTDTTIGKAYYPFENELFLSDNCDCGKAALHQEQVLRKVDVAWFASDPYSESGFFVRRKYRTVAEDDTYDFVTLHDADFRCKCTQKSSLYDEIREEFSIGDAILYKPARSQYLQVGQIIAFTPDKIRLKNFERANTIDSIARPNEIFSTDKQLEIAPSACIRRCHVRYFDSSHIPTPYDRNGAGDYYFIKSCMPDQSQDCNVDNPPLTQGWNPADVPPRRQLQGMGLFCGGGTFDRGLQEGGAVRFKYAIDYAERALHSYRANAQDEIHYFLGSVDDYFAQALAGRANARIAQPGDFDFLSAGSPCQGFSYLQIDRNSAGSRRNASKIASVISFVDFYSPQYLILENVLALTRNIGPKKDEHVFSQLLAALVALGYQVQQFLMDSWLYSSSQRRSRVFIVATAPGLKPLASPPVSHGHPRTSRYTSAALGTSSNGIRFGVRHDHFTPFAHVSASRSVEDLPNIEDAQVQLCPQFPDHRTSMEEAAFSRDRIAIVPVRPRNMGLMQVHHQRRLQGEPQRWCRRVNAIRQLATSKVYRRMHPDGLFGTVLTKLNPVDGINGTVLHWAQHRVMTVMEARRAQGFPDHEVIIGTPMQQLEIIGNSVERNTALVLGLQVRDSWMSNGYHGDQDEDTEQLAAGSPASDDRSIDHTSALRHIVQEQRL